jgi:CheY-like chemotaxis protein
MRILVVEDDDSVRSLLQRVLSRLIYSHNLRYGNDAVAACKSKTFDLLLVDLVIPNVQGIDLISQLKTLQPGNSTHVGYGMPQIRVPRIS